MRAEGDVLRIGERAIPYHNVSAGLPDWGALGIDVVIESSGRATTRAGTQPHLDRGARLVLVSAPSKSLEDCDAVLLPGINLEAFEPARHRIVSMGSRRWHQRLGASRPGQTSGLGQGALRANPNRPNTVLGSDEGAPRPLQRDLAPYDVP